MKRLIIAAVLSLVAIQCEAQTGAPGAAETAQIPRYRFRVLGLFDDQSGLPVEGADVIDVLSGNSVRTTSTGTASLLFLPDGGALVRIRKIGYKLQTLMVSIAPEDTARCSPSAFAACSRSFVCESDRRPLAERATTPFRCWWSSLNFPRGRR